MVTGAREIDCPICGRAKGQHRFSKNNFEILRCSRCGLDFVSYPPLQTQKLYDEKYFFGGSPVGGYVNYDAEKEAMRGVFEDYLRRIAQLRPPGKLLDVGAATGFFLALARKWGWDVAGVEISPTAAERAKARGISIHVGTLEDAPFRAASFDCITLFDVLEHTADPASMLQKVCTLLKPGGLVVINTPDSASILARLLGRRWHLLCPPEHLVFFSQPSLETALTKYHFSILWTGRIGKRFTLQYILQHLTQYLPILRAVLRLVAAHPLLGEFSLPLNLRDNIFLIAKKLPD